MSIEEASALASAGASVDIPTWALLIDLSDYDNSSDMGDLLKIKVKFAHTSKSNPAITAEDFLYYEMVDLCDVLVVDASEFPEGIQEVRVRT